MNEIQKKITAPGGLLPGAVQAEDWGFPRKYGVSSLTDLFILFPAYLGGQWIIWHSQSPNDGILKNNCCNIPFQTKHIS